MIKNKIIKASITVVLLIIIWFLYDFVTVLIGTRKQPIYPIDYNSDMRMPGTIEYPDVNKPSFDMNSKILLRTIYTFPERKISNFIRNIVGIGPSQNLYTSVIKAPKEVKVGDVIQFILEYRNDGLKSVKDMTYIFKLPSGIEFISASRVYTYYRIADWDTKGKYKPVTVIRWDFPETSACSIHFLNVNAKITEQTHDTQCQSYVLPTQKANEIFPMYDPYGDRGY